MTSLLDTLRAPRGKRPPPLGRMRRYTTGSLVGVMALFSIGVIAETHSTPGRISALIVGLVTTWQTTQWEHGTHPALAGCILTGSLAAWCVAIVHDDTGYVVTGFSISAGLSLTAPRLRHWAWSAIAIAVATAAPLALLGISARGVGLSVIGFLISGIMIATFRLNVFAFSLYLEIDRARSIEADLAVMQERYRFAADLHDIQGQTLHVSRLQLQIADRLLETDHHEARTHLREAETLIRDTIAATRSLAYGTRTITLAGELANSLSLLEAASIVVTVQGTPPFDHPLDELLGILVRETTTNLLRHAQVDRVHITFTSHGVTVINDGALEEPRPLRGLAQLSARFAARGAQLAATQQGHTFITKAEVTQ